MDCHSPPLLAELAAQPLQQPTLVVHACHTNSAKQPDPTRRLLHQVLRSLIARRTQSPEIGQRGWATVGAIDDMADMKTHRAGGVHRVTLPRTRSAHLASIAVAFENLRPQRGRDRPRELVLTRLRRLPLQPILPRPKSAVVVVTDDRPSLLGPKLPDSPCPCGGRSGHLHQLLLGDYFADMAPQKLLQTTLDATHTGQPPAQPEWRWPAWRIVRRIRHKRAESPR